MLVGPAPSDAAGLTLLLLMLGFGVVAFTVAAGLHFFWMIPGAAPQGTAIDQNEVPPDSKSSEKTSEIPS